jgi:subtilase family serine protease
VGTGTSTGTDFGEGDLDYQMVLGAAPLADIYIYDGTGGNLAAVLSREVSDNICDVISESYGWSFGAVASANTAHNHHLSMTAVGITYMAASGDHGTDLASFDYPDYDPEVLMVGGTTATTNTSGVRSSEVAWIRAFDSGTGEFWGGGGGWCSSSVAGSATFNVRPSWQTGTGIPPVATVNKRLVPDIALHACGSSGAAAGAYIVYWRGSASGFLGTSASSPLFAAALANVQQRLYSTGGRGSNTNKGRLGRIQDRIYQQAGRSDIYFDITSGNIGNLPSSGGGSLNGTAANAVAGWDFATGWGSVNFNTFYKSFFEGR